MHHGPRHLLCVGRNPTTSVQRRPGHAGSSTCTSLGIVRKRRERSRLVAVPVLNDPLSRSHTRIMSRCRRALWEFVRDEPDLSTDPLPLHAMVMLASDFLNQHRVLDKCAGFALVMSYDLFTRPSETLNTSRATFSSSASSAGYRSVSVIIAHSVAASDATAAQLAKTLPILRHTHGRLAGRVFLIRLPLPSPLQLNDYELTLKYAATRLRLSASKISPHCALHGGASTAVFKLLVDLPGIHQRGRWLGAYSVLRYEKVASSLDRWCCSIPQVSTMQVRLWWTPAS